MKILNLYAGIGGNREKWGEEHEVTAVEFDKDIASVYSKMYPSDEIVVGDAEKYLLENYLNYDFIWASPPCQSHSKIINSQYTRSTYKAKLPDMTLYQIILFLQGHGRKCKWVVENVEPYYKPLLEPSVKLDRHLYWSNFEIGGIKVTKEYIIKDVTTKDAPNELLESNVKNKRQVVRNRVNPLIGLHILKEAFK